MSTRIYLLSALFLSSIYSAAFADNPASSTGIETLGSARFTVITPQLIRMEYTPDGKFIDAASWFARNRDVRDNHYQVEKSDKTLMIDTGTIHLVYTNDGKSFDADNLKADVKLDTGTVSWAAGQEQKGNLGGSLCSLDRRHVAVELDPGLLSRDGWYLLNDSQSVLATSDWYEERPTSHGLDWYFFGYGLDYKAALKSLTTISGAIPLPRKTIMGTWYSRNYPYTDDEFKAIVGEYHDHDFPLDNIVMDYGWHLFGWTGYTWNTSKIHDPTALLKWYHDRGLSVTVNDHPDLSVQPQESVYPDFMKAMGQNPATKKIIPYDGSDKHYMDTFWQYTHAPIIKQGVDFWWLDWRVPKVAKLPSLDGLSILNEYCFNKSETNGKRGLSFSRWAGWGDQRNPINFSGDADSGWQMLTFEVPFTITSGNVGCFFWSHDTGGFRGGRNEESYTRWTQFSALSATLRSHSSGEEAMDRRPWKWPAWAAESMHRSFHLRSCLIPYVYTIAAQAVKDSVPFIRPMYIDHPAEESAYHNGQQYYFGDNMLVAPITAPGQGANHLGWQHVWFPGGTWYQYFSGEKYNEKGDVLVAADINELPLFVRSGVPLPEQLYTERPTSTPLKNLVLRCFPGVDGKTGTSQLYEDDGISNDYKSSGFATTALSYSRRGDEITIQVEPTHGSYKGQVTSRSYTVLLPDTQPGTLQAPANAKLTYDAANGTNRIEIPEVSVARETVIKVTASDLDPEQVRQKTVTQRLDGLLGKPYAQWTDADRSGLTPSLNDAIAAIQGVGIMAVNQNPYLYGTNISLIYYDSAATKPVSGTLSYKSWSAPVTVTNRQPIDVSAAIQAIPPGDTISVPGTENRLLLKVNGHNTTVSVDPAEMSYDLGNLAVDAKSSIEDHGYAESINDGIADGEPNHSGNEWISHGKKTGSVELIWASSVKAKRILLYDRPNLNDQVTAGKLTFSDGSSLDVGELPNDGKTPATVTFPEKTITWVRFDITQGSPTTKNSGLAEIGVFDR